MPVDSPYDGMVALETGTGLWERMFTVAPLVLVGSRDRTGSYDFAPKHMVTPVGSRYFAFVCTPRHATLRNIEREREFTVSYPRPDQVLLTSLAAEPRCSDESKPDLAAFETLPATEIDGAFLKDSYLFLECKLDQFVAGLGEYQLVVGRIVGAYAQEEAMRQTDRDDQDLSTGEFRRPAQKCSIGN